MIDKHNDLKDIPELLEETQLKQNSLILFLFSILFFINLCVNLFPTYKGSFIWNYFATQDDFESFFQLPLLIFNLLIYSLIIIIVRKFKINLILYLITILVFAFLLSMIINGFKSGILAILYIPISYLALFNILPNYKFPNSLSILVLIVLLIWCLSAMFYFAFAPLGIKLNFLSEVEPGVFTFGGFALHRNVFGFYTGITMLLLSFVNIKNKWKIVLWILLLIGLLIAESRSSIVATIVALFYYYFTENKKYRIKLVLLTLTMLVVVSLLYFLYTNYAGRGSDQDTGRVELYAGFFNIISENLFWGTGEPTRVMSLTSAEASPAHNFIVQTIADYGIFVGITFLTLIATIWYKSNLYGRTLWLFIIIVGFVQPYFTFGIPSYFILFIALMGIAWQKERVPVPAN